MRTQLQVISIPVYRKQKKQKKQVKVLQASEVPLARDDSFICLAHKKTSY